MTVSQLKKVSNFHFPGIIFLSKSKNKKQYIDKIRKKLCFDELLVVEFIGRSEGMAMMWKKEVKVIQYQVSAFTFELQIEETYWKSIWWLIGIYASCDAKIRREQWNVLNRRRCSAEQNGIL